MMVGLPRTTLLRYGVAIFGVALATVISANVDILVVKSSLALYFAVVMFSTWYGGRGPGLLAIPLSLLSAKYYIIQPYYTLIPTAETNLFPLVTFSFLTLLINWLLSSLQERQALLTVSESRYRLLFDNNPLPMWVFDSETLRFLTVNDAASFHYGYSRDEFLSMTIKDIRPKEDVTEMLESISKPGSTISPFRAWRHKKKDGTVIDVEVTSHELKFEDRLARLVLANDITERKRAEAAVVESEARLQTIIANLTEGLAVADLDGTILQFNRAALEIHGFGTLEESQQHLDRYAEIFELSNLEGKPLPIEEWPLSRVLRGEALRNLEIKIRRREGNWERVFNYGGVLVEDDNKPLMAIITISDITDRKQAAQSLIDSERRFRALIEHSVDSISLINADNRIIYLSPSVKVVEGYEASELIGRNGLENTHPDDIALIHETVEQLVSRPGEPIPVLWRRKHKDGHWLWLEGVSTNLLHDPAVNAIVTNYRDVSARRQAEAEIQQLNSTLEYRVRLRTAELEAANKELEAFSYSVSHDLRAPLRHINGFSMALVEDYGDELDEIAKGYLQEVRSASQEMAQLIDDVLQLARVTRSEIRRENIDLSELAGEIVAGIKKRSPDRSLDVRVEDGLLAVGDRRLLGIVLTNLFENACKFTSKRETGEIVFAREPSDEDSTAFVIRDNGAGFDMAYADKLFGAFQRLHSSNDFEGTGIGLATVQRIINRHGGRVWAEGIVDEGAAFYFLLPVNKEVEG